MEKLKMETKDLIKENIEKIAELFPNVITEAKDEKGNLVKAVDFELLKQELSDRVVEGDRERYRLTWPGKKEAMLLANLPTSKTLRPVKEESVDWENTGNIYIEGDNLEVLKILQESYLNKIKCIYIDPPYNTGKDFIYRDNFRQSREEYLADSGQVDDDSNRLFQNTETNGRFHSDWLSMMYPRLKLARNLLREDGVIFISIDDNEVHNLRKICDEVFGERNFICMFIWKSKLGKVGTTNIISHTHEYVVAYSKSIEKICFRMVEKHTEERKENLRQWGQADRKEDRPSMFYPIVIDGIEIYPIRDDGSEGRWRVGKDTAMKLLDEGKLQYIKKGNKYEIYRLFDARISKIPYETVLPREIGTTANGAIDLKNMDMQRIFDYSKPKELIKFLIFLIIDKDFLILDFFSGSATTAHAVMQLNAEDGGNRKYIMVQLPEPCDEKSEAYKAGFKTISEIGKERIRRAAKKIKEETGADIDYGFRVFKVDSSNMKDVYYRPDELSQQQLEMMVSNIKEDRTGEDLLIQVMLEWGLELSLPMEKRNISGKEVHFVAGNSLVACFDEDVSEELVREIAKEKPLRVVFRDSSFADDAARINVEELFKMLSPTTEIKVI